MNLKIYICHYPPLLERKKYLDGILPDLGIDFEFFSKYDRDNIDKYTDSFSVDLNVLEYKNSLVPHVKHFAPLISPSIRATTLEHVGIYNSIINNSTHEYHLVLEDDVIFSDNFKSKLQVTLNTLPTPWDIVHISSGCRGRPYITSTDGSNFVKMENRHGWTANGYLLTKQTAQFFAENIFPIALPIDYELNFLQNLGKHNVYWLEHPIVHEGSNPTTNESHKYPSSQLR